jgi:hypothetical protein
MQGRDELAWFLCKCLSLGVTINGSGKCAISLEFWLADVLCQSSVVSFVKVVFGTLHASWLGGCVTGWSY